MLWQHLCALESSPWKKALFEVEWRKMRAREADACRRADLTIAVSEDDRRRFETIAPGIRTASIPNAHGCFWAPVNRDFDRVGMTLLRVDAGIDTGPAYLHGRCEIDEARESHTIIQHRAVIENLDTIEQILLALCRGEHVPPVNISGRTSAVWGQPRLTDYVRWKWAARRRVRSAAPGLRTMAPGSQVGRGPRSGPAYMRVADVVLGGSHNHP